MKIRLRPGEQYKGLAAAEEYFVVELTGPGYQAAIYARIAQEGRSSPWLAEIDRFEVVDNRMPSNWRVRFGGTHAANHFDIAPEPWLRPGFWQDYFDERPGTSDAHADYARELNAMLEECG